MPIVVRALYGTVPRSDLILPGSTSLWLPLVVTCPSCLGMWACKCQLGASLEKARVHHRRQLLNPPMPDRRQHHHRQSAVGRVRNLHRQLARWLVARHSAGQTVGDQPQLVLYDNLPVAAVALSSQATRIAGCPRMASSHAVAQPPTLPALHCVIWHFVTASNFAPCNTVISDLTSRHRPPHRQVTPDELASARAGW